ncbi:MAG TPA: lysophospholipid acyltransferase family protein [Blastocatellia bacterium]|nr:lysophospholipid acyltransferase family protein [Blastocatellia bacterium]
MLSDSSAATDDPLAPGKTPRSAPAASASARRAKIGLSKLKRAGTREGEARVQELKRRVYSQPSLSDYGPRDRFIIRAAGMIFYLLIRVICSSLRWEVRGGEYLDSILAGGHRAIFSFWHTCIFSATWFWRKRGIVVMSSQSRDGEYTGRFIRRFGYGTARGSSTRGAGRALTEMAECLLSGIDVAFTIDGPRGPAYVAKPGAVTLARHTGQAILPFHIAPRRRLELSSWDRLQIPLPFTRAAVFVAEPIFVSPDASREEVAQKQSELQTSLDQLRNEAEKWLAG